MAQFRATIRGQRGEASRLGSKTSGLHVTVNGWTAGITVHCEHTATDDFFSVFLTSGSSYGMSKLLFQGTATEIQAKIGKVSGS